MSFFAKLRELFLGARTNGRPAEIPCEEALMRVHEFLDGELDGLSEAEVEAHFEACDRCYPHLRLERCFRRAVRRAASGESAPPELKARIAKLVSEADSEA